MIVPPKPVRKKRYQQVVHNVFDDRLCVSMVDVFVHAFTMTCDREPNADVAR